MSAGPINLKPGDEDNKKRLDKFLVERMGGDHSRSSIQRIIKAEKVLVNGMPAKSHHKVAPGEEITVGSIEKREITVGPEEIPLDIVYEDSDVIVVNKPSGMVVHPAPGNYTGTLANALVAHCGKLSGSGGDLKPGIVHRLDKETSGLLVAAKNDAAHRKLSGQFKARTVNKIYVALVKGIVQLDNDSIDFPIARDSHDRKKMRVDSASPREASTVYRVLERFGGTTLLEIRLGTGRTHQIRVHLAHIGHPILGDDKYGYKDKTPRLALHSKTIGFIHPRTAKYVEFTRDVPRAMKEMIDDSKEAGSGKNIKR